jgi:hypothetical protein
MTISIILYHHGVFDVLPRLFLHELDIIIEGTFGEFDLRGIEHGIWFYNNLTVEGVGIVFVIF